MRARHASLALATATLIAGCSLDWGSTPGSGDEGKDASTPGIDAGVSDAGAERDGEVVDMDGGAERDAEVVEDAGGEGCGTGFVEADAGCVDIDECSAAVNRCLLADGADCTNTAGSFSCQCPDGYAGSGAAGLGCVSRITATAQHACVLLADRTVACWGVNTGGKLGDGTTTSRTTPVRVSGLADVSAVAPGVGHTCALLGDHTVRCWGGNQQGQLGDGVADHGADCPADCSLTPVAVSGVRDAVALSAGSGLGHTCVVHADGGVSCWGPNGAGQLGDGTTVDRPVPTRVAGLSGVIDVAAGARWTCAVLADGSVACWGDNQYGQLGDGTTLPRGTPAPVQGIEGAIAVDTSGSHTCALLASGSVRCWGSNLDGALGDGVANHGATCEGSDCSLLPVDVDGVSDATALSLGNARTCVRLAGGALQCWGRDYYASSSGAGLVTNAVALAAGGYFTCALLADGTGRCWGLGAHLGDGVADHPPLGDTTDFSSSPVTLQGIDLW